MSRVLFKSALVGALLASVSGLALAQDPPDTETETALEPIIVTGVRVDQPLDQVGRAVSVVTAEEIALRQQRFVFDALEAVPGVQVIRSGGAGSLASVSIRGLPSDQTLVVQDGIVSNNPAFFGNTFDFANFDTADIAQIEVLRGAQSTLYGSDAISGVINIVTKDGREGFGAEGFIEGGSFGTFRGAATVLGGDERLSGRLTIAGTETRGFSAADEADGNTEDDGFRNITVSSKVRARPINSLELDAVFRFSDSAVEFDGFTPPDFTFGDSDDTGDTRELSVAGSATHTALEGRLENRVRITYFDSSIINEGGGFVTFDADGSRVSYEYQGTARPIEPVTVVGGFEFERERAETGSTPGVLDVTTTSLFALAQLRPLDFVSIEGGVRVDNNSEFGSETTFSVSGSIDIPRTPLRLRGSWAEGFQAPTSGELDFNLAQAAIFEFDPAIDLFLTPERSRGFDIGAELTVLEGRANLQATYFQQEVEDLLTFLFVPGAPSVGIFTNVEEFETQGVEIATQIILTPKLRFDGAYTYVDATNITLDVVQGNQPDNRFNAQIAYTPTRKLSLSGGLTFNGSEIDGVETLDSFTLVNLRAAYQVTEIVEVFARIENAFDADFQDNLGFGTAPVSAFGGVRARF
ncbi:MAG: TonB-dependent receptor plug domain-containing protein [Maricaulaceae bacterium]